MTYTTGMTGTTDKTLISTGRQAYHNGEPAAPALNSTVIAAIGDRPVGDPRTREIMCAFIFGYEQEREAELARILAED
jgi:hypothetical protein